MNTIILPNVAATERFGAAIAEKLRSGDMIALSGDLGAGKTTLARGLLKALGLEAEAPSPSFSIVQPYDPPEVRLPVWHVDLYRIEHAEEVAELGLEEVRDDGVLLIEWPERMVAALRAEALQLRLEIGEGGARRLTAEVPPAWETRWPPNRSK